MEWKEECSKIALIRENWVPILFINSYFFWLIIMKEIIVSNFSLILLYDNITMLIALLEIKN